MTRTQDTERVARYGGWSPDRQGWIFGLSGIAVATVVAAGLPLLLAAGAHDWLLAATWLPVWAVLTALVTVPVRGRAAAVWLRDSILRAVGVATGWSHFQSRAAAGLVDDPGEADLPGVLSGVTVHDGPPFGPLLHRPAVIADQRLRTWAVTARIAHTGIGLCEPAARARMGAGLCDLLEGTATSELVSVLALQTRTLPDDGAERDDWHRQHLHPAAPPLARQVSTELSRVMTGAGVRHEAFLTLVVPESRITGQAKESGGGLDGRARVLYGLMAEIEARLLGPIGATEVCWLDSAALAAAIRTGFAPDDRAALVHAGHAGLPIAAAGPGTAPAPPRRYYTHDAWHSASCTLLLPDKGAVMGALAPVLAPSTAGERRSMTVFFEPIAARRADRMIGRESMSSDLAGELRRRGGFQTRAVHTRDAARIEGQDIRVADGHALIRVAITASVTVPATWSITDHARRLEASITGSGFTSLRLDLAQDSGFAAACIPLGIGLPRRRGTR